MSESESELVLEAFQLDYLKFQKVVYQVLGLLQGNTHPEKKSSILKKCLTIGIMAIFIISLFLNVNYEFEGELRMAISTYSLNIVGCFQVFCKLIVLNLFSEEIKQLIGWIGAFHVDPVWKDYTSFVKERFQITLRFLKAVEKFVVFGGTAMGQLILLTYFWNGTILFRIPYLQGSIKYFWQHIAMTYIVLFYILIEFIHLFFGFYFVAILNIFIDSLEKLDNENFIKSSRNHLKDYHKIHLEIWQKLKDFVRVFSFVQNIQAAACLPLIVNSFYNSTIYPNIFLNHLILIPVITQLFEICLLGEFFDSKTTEIFRKLYLSKWYEMSRDDKMILVLMMRMTIKPFSLKVAGIYNINMMAFVDVIKFCFSFCAILLAFT
uniref:Odorant receptor n=1 Tax=Phlebotomus papatasi TaxID=29031 RepID=A0A3F2ZEM5_PHLPP